jgi:TATA-binding protein-associated factor Taf7
LKNEGLSLDDGDDEISEEDLARLEQELAEALGDDDIGMSDDESADDTETGNIAEEDEEEEEEEKTVKLRNWQLRRLASALKVGRRKTSVRMWNLIKDKLNDVIHVIIWNIWKNVSYISI